MNTQRMQLRAEQFAGIASGYGDAAAMAVLGAGQLAKRKALVAMVLRAARSTPCAPALDEAAALIVRAEQADAAAVAGVIAHPHLDAWATLCLHRLADREKGAEADLSDLLGHLASYAAAAAIAAGLDFDLELPTVDGAASIPGLGNAAGLGPGRARATGTASSVTFTGAGGTVVTLDGPGWRARRCVALTGGGRLAIEDLDPYRHCYDWRPLTYLTEARARDLEKLLSEAWLLIERHHPGHAEGLRHSLRAMVPLATPENGTMISAASRHAAGAIGASIPDSAADLALLLIHEYMHAKLGALLDLVDLVERDRPASRAGFHAPWRLDPRPAGALLQGIYAHAGVTDYWRMRRHGPDGDTRRAAAQFAYWRAMNRIALDALINSGELTPIGKRFALILRNTLDGWETETVDPVIASRVRLFVTAQSVRWLLINAHADDEETERAISALRFGTSPPTFAERGTIAAGAVRGPADAPGILADLHRWLDGRTDPVGPSGPDPDTAGVMLLNGDAAGAERACLARLDADARDDDAWIGLAVARALPAGRNDRSDPTDLATRLLHTRPELLRNAVLKVQHAGNHAAATELVKKMALP
ncbi:HEXXH motif domain-containing protein [Dactylosporangium sp. CA-233914]|uniref:HEXXH motif domain-containing protein n=1 Tax=Dactylosporangium sp. CA-233914 TaxID=3239934 RepID=UPI003D941988